MQRKQNTLFRWLQCLGGRLLGTDFRYTALGDSLARGFGATNYYGYVEYFRDFLATKYDCVRLNNLSIPGLTSRDLLLQLKLDFITRHAVQNANVITISMGGDNLLGCASNNYRDIGEHCAMKGVVKFGEDWPQILEEIRHSIGSNAQIYVVTLYNPYMGNEPNFSKAETFIKPINDIIKNAIFTYQYKVVDVHTDFQGQFTDGSWKVCTWTHFCEPSRNPHPTDRGHQKMAKLHEWV